ncbi:MAG TPA: hypothetical protein VLA34_12470, partial [Candidatus Krumholzibacterium sp.]|nr:hypothetical protein [Candidatus Krumholzibacterium sp.]
LGREAERLEIDVVTWRPGSGYFSLDSGEGWDAASGLSGYDVIVAGDGRDLFDAPGIARIREFVGEGGGLVMLSSEDSPLGDAVLLDSLGDLVPLDMESTPRIGKGEYRARVVHGPAMDPLGVLMASTGTLEDIPPLDAVFAGFRPAAASVVSLVSEEGYPLVTSKSYGNGMVTAVTAFPLWKWNLAGPEGRTAYMTLMTSILEQAAGELERAPLSVRPDRPVYRSGERIGISIFTRVQSVLDRMRGEVYRLEDADTVPSVTFLPSQRRGAGEAWEADLEPLAHGEYRVRVTAFGAGGEKYEGETGLTVDPVSIEFLTTSRDLASLRRLASMSGGSVIDEDRLDDLFGKVDSSPRSITRRSMKPSRSNIYLFILTVLLLSAEWGLRKLRGML